jgi:PIN domain nuclease of toxin-antitoxin system
MSLLLDTHAFLWFAHGDAQLSTRAKQAIIDEQGSVALSVGSVWEIAIKVSIGKLHLGGPVERAVAHALQATGVALQPITLRQLEGVAGLPFPDRVNRDPFDRLLVCQAIDLGWAIVSRDEAFDSYGVTRVW